MRAVIRTSVSLMYSMSGASVDIGRAQRCPCQARTALWRTYLSPSPVQHSSKHGCHKMHLRCTRNSPQLLWKSLTAYVSGYILIILSLCFGANQIHSMKTLLLLPSPDRQRQIFLYRLYLLFDSYQNLGKRFLDI